MKIVVQIFCVKFYMSRIITA